jgi:membrane protease subunit (stomatin/prohibitin family)
MFKKEIIQYKLEPTHLISKVPGQSFKKGKSLEIPQGFEAILMDPDGSQEVIKNIYLIKLERTIHYIYFVQSNRKLMKTRWGTPTRIKVMTQQGEKTMGGFGNIDFQLLNPLRFINTRLQNDDYIDEKTLTEFVLSRISDLLHQAVPELEPMDISRESVITNKFKELLTPLMEKTFDSMGVKLQSFIIENLNFHDVEEGQ